MGKTARKYRHKKQDDSADTSRHIGRRFDLGLLVLAVVLATHLLVLHLGGILDLGSVRVMGVDPVGYYVYLRSAFFDHDLDFRNEYTELRGIGPVGADQPPTETGKVGNPFAVGCAVLWLPVFLVGHLCALLTSAAANGYSQPYHTAVYLANVGYGVAAMFLAYMLARRYFSVRAAATGAAAVWLCTSFFYYLFPLMPMSHTTSMFVVTALIWLWARADGRFGLGRAAALGAVGGLAALVRWQNALFMLLPATELLIAGWRERRSGRQIAEMTARLALLSVTFLAVFSLQMFVWHSLYGRWLIVPQGGGFIAWYKPQVTDVLFSTGHGLISVTPVVAACLLGLALLVRPQRRLAAGLIAAFLLQLYVNSIVGSPGWSFGMRRFVNCTSLFVVGAAHLAEFVQTRPVWRRSMLAVTAVLAVWNVLFAVQYYFGLIPRAGDLTFAQFVTDKFRLITALYLFLTGG